MNQQFLLFVLYCFGLIVCFKFKIDGRNNQMVAAKLYEIF